MLAIRFLSAAQTFGYYCRVLRETWLGCSIYCIRKMAMFSRSERYSCELPFYSTTRTIARFHLTICKIPFLPRLFVQQLIFFTLRRESQIGQIPPSFFIRASVRERPRSVLSPSAENASSTLAWMVAGKQSSTVKLVFFPLQLARHANTSLRFHVYTFRSYKAYV